MFQRFTRAARSAVSAAVEEAVRRNDVRVGTEHLLLGVTRSPSADVMKAVGGRFTARDVRDALEKLDKAALRGAGIDLVEPSAGPTSQPRKRSRRLPFTQAAKQVLKGALNEAIAFQHRSVGPEHILLRLTDLSSMDPVARVFAHLGVSPETLRVNLTTHMQRHQ